jgi:adenylylsulfate kinase-like enzyme
MKLIAAIINGMVSAIGFGKSAYSDEIERILARTTQEALAQDGQHLRQDLARAYKEIQKDYSHVQ